MTSIKININPVLIEINFQTGNLLKIMVNIIQIQHYD